MNKALEDTSAREIMIDLPCCRLEYRGSQVIILQDSPYLDGEASVNAVSITFSPHHAQELAAWLQIIHANWRSSPQAQQSIGLRIEELQQQLVDQERTRPF